MTTEQTLPSPRPTGGPQTDGGTDTAVGLETAGSQTANSTQTASDSQSVSGTQPAGGRETSVTGVLDGIAIVVPARNEEQLIARCLRSLELTIAAAAERRVVPARIVTVVVVDSSDDRTEAIARSFAGVTVLTTDAQSVGEARRVGVAGALQLLAAHPADSTHPVHPVDVSRLWVANTDADSAVPLAWLVENLDAAAHGADALLGTVRPDLADFTPAQRAIWARDHPRTEPAGHIHGANLGFRASAYLSAGGFSGLAQHEDIDLVARLEAQDARVVASDRAEVLTSGRQAGRTPGGYAGYLRDALPPG